MWHDPAAHACDFAERYAEPMDYHVAQRMTELGIEMIGMPDRDALIEWAAFHPDGVSGGGYAPDGRCQGTTLHPFPSVQSISANSNRRFQPQ